jgi:hypothetical protein
MPAEYLENFNALLSEFVAPDFFKRFYGIDPDSKEVSDFIAWAPRNTKRQPQDGRCINRVAWELYTNAYSVLPLRWAAARLGMTEESLSGLLAAIDEKGLTPRRYRTGLLVDVEALRTDMLRSFPSLRGKLFRNHSAFCRALQEAAKCDVGVTINLLPCKTSQLLHDQPEAISYCFDCITLEPLSIEHSTWLATAKPRSLEPDRCSRLTYCRYCDVLREHLMTSSETPGLERYRVLAKGA